MIVQFSIAAWILSLVLVTGLCLAARRGDVQMHTDPIAESVDSVEPFLVIRPPAADPAGRPAPSSPLSRPGMARSGAGSVRPEDYSQRHSQKPGDLALQPG